MEDQSGNIRCCVARPMSMLMLGTLSVRPVSLKQDKELMWVGSKPTIFPGFT